MVQAPHAARIWRIRAAKGGAQVSDSHIAAKATEINVHTLGMPMLDWDSSATKVRGGREESAGCEGAKERELNGCCRGPSGSGAGFRPPALAGRRVGKGSGDLWCRLQAS